MRSFDDNGNDITSQSQMRLYDIYGNNITKESDEYNCYYGLRDDCTHDDYSI